MALQTDGMLNMHDCPKDWTLTSDLFLCMDTHPNVVGTMYSYIFKSCNLFVCIDKDLTIILFFRCLTLIVRWCFMVTQVSYYRQPRSWSLEVEETASHLEHILMIHQYWWDCHFNLKGFQIIRDGGSCFSFWHILMVHRYWSECHFKLKGFVIGGASHSGHI